MNDPRQQSFLIVIFVLFACCVHAGADEELNMEIEGEYQYSASFSRTGDVIQEKRAFSFVSHGFRWLIRTIPLDAGTSGGIEYYEVGFDGKYVYEVTKLRDPEFTSRPMQEFLEKSELKSRTALKPPPRNAKIKNQAVGLTYADILPNANPTHAVPFWIAYTSAWYFSTNRTGTARQIWPDGKSVQQPSKNLVRASWELTETEPKFLRKLVYYIPISTGGTSAIKFKDDETNYCPIVRYSVGVFTNINGTLIPLDFTLVRYRQADIQAGSSSPRVLTKLSAKATRISFIRRASEMAVFKNELKFITYVTDLRLGPSNHSQRPIYIVTNGVWPSVSEIGRLNMRKPDGTFGARSSSRVNPTAGNRNVIRCVLGVISMFGVVFALVTVRNHNRKEKV